MGCELYLGKTGSKSWDYALWEGVAGLVVLTRWICLSTDHP